MNKQQESDRYDDHVMAWLSERYTRLGVTGTKRKFNAPICRKFKPVVVNGRKYPSLTRAARAIGCAKACLSVALRRGTQYRGQSIRWAPEAA